MALMLYKVEIKHKSNWQIFGGYLMTDEQKLKSDFSSETWRQVVLENALDAVIGVNANDEIIDWNLQAEAIFSWKKSEVLGRSLAQIIIPENQREAHARGMKHFFATGNGPILNFAPASEKEVDAIAKKLKAGKVSFARRGPGIRLSAHAYNTEADALKVLSLLK